MYNYDGCKKLYREKNLGGQIQGYLEKKIEFQLFLWALAALTFFLLSRSNFMLVLVSDFIKI